MSKKMTLTIFAISVFLLGASGLLITSNVFKRTGALCIGTFIINGLLWITLLLIDIKRRAYSLTIIHWLFCIFFFFIAAIVQYAANSFPWIGYRDDNIILKTNLLLFVWTISFIIGGRLSKKPINKSDSLKSEFIPKEKNIILITIGAILILLYKVSTIGFSGLFSKSLYTDAINIEDGSLSLLVNKFLVSYCCVSTLITIILSKTRNNCRIYALINIICLFLAFFPPNLSRNVVATVYGSVLLALFPSFKKNRRFIIIFFLAFLVLFPFFNVFRYKEFSNVNIIDTLNATIDNMSSEWTAGHYDAYTTLSLTIDHVKESGVTYGRQLLGVLLFFIPRSLWPNKPIGSGAYMAESIGTFSNISCPLPGEGYINFGLIGLIIFGILFGYAAKKIDDLYWQSELYSLRIETLYPILLFMFFFMCRGDLLSSFAYLCAFVFVWFIMLIDWKSVTQRLKR